VLQVNKRKIKTFLGRIRGRVAENDELLFLHHRATVIMLYSRRIFGATNQRSCGSELTGTV
jgi:hypothetical protein